MLSLLRLGHTYGKISMHGNSYSNNKEMLKDSRTSNIHILLHRALAGEYAWIFLIWIADTVIPQAPVRVFIVPHYHQKLPGAVTFAIIFLIKIITVRYNNFWKTTLLRTKPMNETNNKQLAYELASTLQDLDSISVYFAFVEKYSPAFLRKTLNKVMSLPDEKIKRTRGALFTFLVNQNGWRPDSRR